MAGHKAALQFTVREVIIIILLLVLLAVIVFMAINYSSQLALNLNKSVEATELLYSGG